MEQNIEKLKAKAYDLLLTREQINNQLMQINNAITQEIKVKNIEDSKEVVKK